MLPASRLAATLGPAPPPPQVHGPDDGANGPPGLLDVGGGKDFSFGGETGAGSPRAASAGRVAARLRWRLGLRAAVLLGVLSMAAGAWFWWRVATAVPEVMPLSAVTEAGTAEAGATAGEDGTGTAGSGGEGGQPGSGEDNAGDSVGTAVVHVAGAVKRAGVVKLPRGSRVHDAIVAAGGGTAAADLNRLNLAAVLEDGQKIHVPRQGEPVQQEAAGSGAGMGSGDSNEARGASGSKVDLNTATAEELDALPRVGPVLAQRIVDWRAEHGNFKAVEELDAVDGVGPKMLEALLPLVTV